MIKSKRKLFLILLNLFAFLIFSFVWQGTCSATGDIPDNFLTESGKIIERTKQAQGLLHQLLDWLLKVGEGFIHVVKKTIGWFFNNKNVPSSLKSWLRDEWRFIKEEFKKETVEIFLDIKKNFFKPFSYFE